MDRYFAIYHGLTAAAPWGVACERSSAWTSEHKAALPKVELLMLCRTEKEATEYAKLTSLGNGLQQFREEKLAAQAAEGVKT
jgi:hypothetical protein